MALWQIGCGICSTVAIAISRYKCFTTPQRQEAPIMAGQAEAELRRAGDPSKADTGEQEREKSRGAINGGMQGPNPVEKTFLTICS